MIEDSVMKPQKHHSTAALNHIEPPPNCYSVLIVDDLPANRRFLSRLLTSVGYLPMEAQNGTEAINELVRRRPHLVIMDVEMPGISGTEAVRRIRRLPAKFSGTPIIAGSGNPDSQLKRDILSAGADAFLPKPMDVAVLLETVAMLLKRHWQRRETDPDTGARPVEGVNEVGNAA